jgi:hypothetical protein
MSPARDGIAASLFSTRGLLLGSFVMLLLITGGLTGLTLNAQIAAANADSISMTPTAYAVTTTTHGPQLAVTFDVSNPTGHSITVMVVQARARANGEVIVSAMASERVSVPAGETVAETIEFRLNVDRNETVRDVVNRTKTGIRENAITFGGTVEIRIVNKRTRIAIDPANATRQ